MAALLIRYISGFGATLSFPFESRVTFALLFVSAGLLIDISAILSFRKVRTTINPLRPKATSSLVDVGIYRFTRNPMYLGLVLILLGVSSYYASPFSLVVIIAFMVFITRFQIVPEERAMFKLFGEEFSNYQNKVRRWL